MANFDIVYRIATDLAGLNKGVQDTAKATEQIDQKMTGLQKSVADTGKALAGLFGAAAIAGEIKALGQEVISLGSHLTDLRAKTGISLEGLQTLKVAAEQNGVAVDTLANAANKLGVALAGGGKGVKDAVDRLGLSFDTLRKQSPEDNLATIAKAMSSIENPAERAKLATELFGKAGLEILPLLTDEFGRQAEAAKHLGIVMSDETVEAADKFDDQMVVLHATFVKFMADVLTPLLPGLFSLAQWFASLAGGAITLGRTISDWIIGVFLKAQAAFWEFEATTQQFAANHPILGKVLGVTADTLARVKEQSAQATEQLRSFNEKTAAATSTVNDHTTSLKKTIPVLHDFGDASEQAARKAQEAFKKLLDTIHEIEGTNFVLKTLSIADALKQMGESVPVPSMKDLANQSIRSATDVEALRGSVEDLERGGRFLSAAMVDVNKEIGKLPDVMPSATEAIESALKPVKSLGEELSGNLRSALQKIPDILQKAFEGGGGIVGAAKSIGVLMSKAIVDPILDRLSSAAKSALSVGSTIAAGVGGAVGGGVGSSIAGTAGLLGATALAHAGVIAGTVAIGAATAGIGLAAVGAYYGLKKLFSLSPEYKQAKTDQEALVTTLNNVASASQRGEMAAAQGSEAYKLIAVVARDAFIKTGLSAEQAGEKVKALLNTSDPQAFTAAMNEVNAALADQAQDAADLDAAIKRYGFSIEELGPAMQKQQLDEQAKELLNDWRLLVGSGIEVSAVNARMAETMQTYLDTARKTGQEVPQELRPVIESMINQGLLVDENGEKFKDLASAGIQFSETMTQGFDKIAAKLDILIQKLSLGLTSAIKDIPDISTDATVNVHYNLDSINAPDGLSFGSTGGFVDAFGIQAFGAGGVVMPFMSRGTDTVPAMLTPGEVVLTASQARGIGTSSDPAVRELMIRLPEMIRSAVTAGLAQA